MNYRIKRIKNNNNQNMLQIQFIIKFYYGKRKLRNQLMLLKNSYNNLNKLKKHMK